MKPYTVALATRLRWLDDADGLPWAFEADDDSAPGADLARFMLVRRDRALVFTFGFNDEGPLLVVRAYDGEMPAQVDAVGFDGDLTLAVGDVKGEPEDGLF